MIADFVLTLKGTHHLPDSDDRGTQVTTGKFLMAHNLRIYSTELDDKVVVEIDNLVAIVIAGGARVKGMRHYCVFVHVVIRSYHKCCGDKMLIESIHPKEGRPREAI